MKSYSNEVISKQDIEKVEQKVLELEGTIAKLGFWIAGLVFSDIVLTVIWFVHH